MKPLILVTNDDGILAPGLAVLAEAAASVGDVVICAPDEERSGSSHAITLHTHLRAHRVRDGWWRVSGTPVDCVYLAVHHLCPTRPRVVVSGINAGYNLGGDVFYSGTLGAAAEGFLRGISSVAFSIDRGVDPRWVGPIAKRLIRALVNEPRLCLLNVNVPGIEGHAVVGESIEEQAAAIPVEVTRLGMRVYQDTVETRTDLMGRPYYWIGGPPLLAEHKPGDDTHAVSHGRISVTPLDLNLGAADLEPTRDLLGRSHEP